MSADLKAYEVLGVKPGVSNTELKAAHRDLAKVWHPDRFLHDPRLQAKAQEKLKEINQAYEQLISGKTPRPVNSPPPAREYRAQTAPSPAPRGSSWQSVVVALLLFVAVFAVVTRALLQKRNAPLQQEEAAAEQSTKLEPERAKRPESNSRKENRAEPTPAAEAEAAQTVPIQPTPAVATVTVMIDPANGLLARPDCPVRSRMTYPRGSEPTAYCNISHAPPPKESRLNKITKVFQNKHD